MLTFAMLGTQTIIIILVIALLVFGPQKLPDIGRQLGQAMRELRKMSGDMQRALDLDGHSSYDYYGSSSYENSASYSYTPPVSHDQPLDQYGLDGHYDEPKAIAEKGATDATTSADATPAAEGETPAKKPRRSRKTVADAASETEASPVAEGETPAEKPARRSRKKTPATETVADATPAPAEETPAAAVATAVPSDVPTTPVA